MANNTNNRPGWYEPEKKSIITNTGLKQVSPRHYECSQKKHVENICANPIKVKEAKCDNAVIFVLEKKMNSDELSELFEEFLDGNKDTGIECITGVSISVGKKYANEFGEFLEDRKIRFSIKDEDEKHDDPEER